MNVTLYFRFESAVFAKNPIEIPVGATVLLPDIGDTVESADGERHLVVSAFTTGANSATRSP